MELRGCHNDHRHSGHSVATAATPSPQRTAQPIQLKVQLGLPTSEISSTSSFCHTEASMGGLHPHVFRVPGALLSRTCSSCQKYHYLFCPNCFLHHQFVVCTSCLTLGGSNTDSSPTPVATYIPIKTAATPAPSLPQGIFQGGESE